MVAHQSNIVTWHVYCPSNNRSVERSEWSIDATQDARALLQDGPILALAAQMYIDPTSVGRKELIDAMRVAEIENLNGPAAAATKAMARSDDCTRSANLFFRSALQTVEFQPDYVTPLSPLAQWLVLFVRMRAAHVLWPVSRYADRDRQI